MSKPRIRANGEGSIYHRGYDKNGRDLGWAAYVWVTTPNYQQKRKYCYGKTREECHNKWIKLQTRARKGPVDTSAEKVESYAHYWLNELVRPNLSPGTYDTYSGWVQRQIVPGLGGKRLDKLLIRDIQTWMNSVARTCQCCFQGKDQRRKIDQRRCCAATPVKCCNDLYTKTSLLGLRRTMRAMLGRAIVDEKLDKNLASFVVVQPARSHKGKKKRWSSSDAKRFLMSARLDEDPFYVVYIWILVLGLRRGEALGISEDDIDFDSATLDVSWQVQRVGGRLVRREVKTDDSETSLPLPGICLTAAKLRIEQKTKERENAAEAWQGSPILMCTPLGTSPEPRNFNKVWDRRCDLAGVPRITPRDARRTCASLLADLDVHPRVAMRILRHAKFSITMEVYTEVSDESTREALRKLSDELI